MIIGNIMRKLPKAEARRIARTRSRRISFAIHGDTHGAPARERVLFARTAALIANVHGTDDNRLRRTLQRPLYRRQTALLPS